VNGNPTPSASITIRPACPTDLDSVYQFLCELEDEVLDKMAFRAVYEQNLGNPQIHYLIAELAAELVGFVSCHVQPLLHHVGKVGEIQELFVKASYRNQGIGHLLVDALERLAQQEGFVNLEVTTNQKRLDTVRFYERELFRRTHIKLVKPIQH